MTAKRLCWILNTLLAIELISPRVVGGEKTTPKEETSQGHQPSPEATPLSPLRIRPVVVPLNSDQLRLFFLLYKRNYFGADPSKKERMAFIVEGATTGEWDLVLAPRSGEYRREAHRGPIPAGTIGIVHTHPRDARGCGVGPEDSGAPGIYRDGKGEPVRVNWNYIVHSQCILAVDAQGKQHRIAGKGWMSDLMVDPVSGLETQSLKNQRAATKTIKSKNRP